MSVSRIASRYAKSLLDIARQQNQLQDVVDDVQHIKNALQNHDLIELVRSPVISAQHKKTAFDKIFSDNINPLSSKFLSLLISKKREALLPHILTAFEKQYNKLNQRTNVKVTFAKKPDENLISKIKAKLEQSSATSKNVQLKIHVNPAIIGGYIIEFDDKRFDASVAFKLEQIKQTFSNA